MGYWETAALSRDADFLDRAAACYAIEHHGTASPYEPSYWVSLNTWALAAAPGFGDAYASALANSVTRPGRDPSVISDGQILAAVQLISKPQTTDQTTPTDQTKPADPGATNGEQTSPTEGDDQTAGEA